MWRTHHRWTLSPSQLSGKGPLLARMFLNTNLIYREACERPSTQTSQLSLIQSHTHTRLRAPEHTACLPLPKYSHTLNRSKNTETISC